MLKLIAISFSIISIFTLSTSIQAQDKNEIPFIESNNTLKIIPANNEYFLHSWLLVTEDSTQIVQCIINPLDTQEGNAINAYHQQYQSETLQKTFRNAFKAIILSISNDCMHNICMLSPNESIMSLKADAAGIASWTEFDKSGNSYITVTGMYIRNLGNIYFIFRDKQQTSKEMAFKFIQNLFAFN